MLATARHAGWMGERVVAIHATGGAAQNRAILQVMADVHGAEVRQLAVAESAALGAALRAFHGEQVAQGDRKSTRLNSSHQIISYAVFCLKKKKKIKTNNAMTYIRRSSI